MLIEEKAKHGVVYGNLENLKEERKRGRRAKGKYLFVYGKLEVGERIDPKSLKEYLDHYLDRGGVNLSG